MIKEFIESFKRGQRKYRKELKSTPFYKEWMGDLTSGASGCFEIGQERVDKHDPGFEYTVCVDDHKIRYIEKTNKKTGKSYLWKNM